MLYKSSQRIDGGNFGLFKIQLPVGEYIVSVAGGTNSMPKTEAHNNLPFDGYCIAPNFWDWDWSQSDDMCNALTGVAVVANQATNADLVLKRIVVLVDVQLTDELPVPSWVKSITMTFNPTTTKYYPSKAEQVLVTEEIQKIVYDGAPLDLKFAPLYMFGLPKGTTGKLVIEVKDASAQTVITKEVEDINVYTNRKNTTR